MSVRISIIGLFFCFNIFSGYGGNENKLSGFHLENVKYDSIFKKIEELADVNFSYFSDLVPDSTLTINFENIDLKGILDNIFRGTRIAYMLFTDQVILYEKDQAKRSNA